MRRTRRRRSKRGPPALGDTLRHCYRYCGYRGGRWMLQTWARPQRRRQRRRCPSRPAAAAQGRRGGHMRKLAVLHRAPRRDAARRRPPPQPTPRMPLRRRSARRRLHSQPRSCHLRRAGQLPPVDDEAPFPALGWAQHRRPGKGAPEGARRSQTAPKARWWRHHGHSQWHGRRALVSQPALQQKGSHWLSPPHLQHRRCWHQLQRRRAHHSTRASLTMRPPTARRSQQRQQAAPRCPRPRRQRWKRECVHRCLPLPQRVAR